jgi:hypothetical protein
MPGVVTEPSFSIIYLSILINSILIYILYL